VIRSQVLYQSQQISPCVIVQRGSASTRSCTQCVLFPNACTCLVTTTKSSCWHVSDLTMQTTQQKLDRTNHTAEKAALTCARSRQLQTGMHCKQKLSPPASSASLLPFEALGAALPAPANSRPDCSSPCFCEPLTRVGLSPVPFASAGTQHSLLRLDTYCALNYLSDLSLNSLLAEAGCKTFV